jgi:hypothetical protein
MKLVLLSCAVALGCGAKESKGAAKCQAVIGPAEDRITAREHANDPNYAVTPETMATIDNILIESCKRDGWSEKMITCVEAVNEDDAMFKCLNNLSPDQESALRKSLIEALLKKRATNSEISPPGK